MLYQIHTAPLARKAEIDLPASKSLSNRALILKALSGGSGSLSHLSDSDDTHVMQAAFDGDHTLVDIGAAGTSMRFLTAYYASTPGVEVTLTGSERMKQRPIAILVDALRSLGADIRYTEAEGFPPLHICGKQLRGGALTIDGSTSSQYISALLMIAPTLTDGLTLHLTGQITSRPYIDMTLSMMRRFGAKCTMEGPVITVSPRAYVPADLSVESDWSAASYWYELLALCHYGKVASGLQDGALCKAASMLQDKVFSKTSGSQDFALSEVTLLGLHPDSLQGDSRVSEYFAELGIATRFTDRGAVLSAMDQPLPTEVCWNLAGQPDLAQTLIVTCCALDVRFRISGLHTLRIKETDRITALQTELRRLGFVVGAEGDDVMYWNGERCESQCPVVISTYHDHRMALAFAPMALCLHHDALYVDDPGVVSKSYPAYWDHLRQIGLSVSEAKL